MTLEEITKTLANQRKSLNISQLKLSQSLGYGIDTANKIEAGKNAYLFTFLDYVDALGMEVVIKKKEDSK